jgi:uncharacterized protein YegL
MSTRSGSRRIQVEVPEGAAKRKVLQLLIDTSESMKSEIGAVNAHLHRWLSELAGSGTWKATLDLSIVTFGRDGVQVRDLRNGGVTTDGPAFTPVGQVAAPTFHAGNVTPMVEAIEKGLDLIAAYKAHLRSNGLDYFRPYQVLITDGYPTDSTGNFSDVRVPDVATRLITEQNGRHVLFRAFSVPGANNGVLARLAGSANAVTPIADVRDWGTLLLLVSNSVERVLGTPGGTHETPQTVRSDRLDPDVDREQTNLMRSLIADLDGEF